MFDKHGYYRICSHCSGSGTCKNKIVALKMVWGLIPIPVRSSDASCLAAEGIDPSKFDFIVRCAVCKGTGYVFLPKDGREPTVTKGARC